MKSQVRVGMRSRALLTATSLFLAAATIGAFWPVLGNGFVDYDDLDYLAIADAAITPDCRGFLRAFSLIGAANWHPLTWLSHRLDLGFFGRAPRGHHAVSIGLHAAGAVLLFLCLAGMTGAVWPSALTAALFAVHPLRVESVAWVAERKDVLAGFFFMLTLLAYLAFVRKPRPVSYLMVAGVCLLALLSKATAVTLPLVLLLLDWWPLRRWQDPSSRRAPHPTARRLLLEKLPLLAMSVAVSAVTWAAQKRGGTMTLMESLPFGARLANALVSAVGYAGKLTVPRHLSVFYPYAAQTTLWKPLGAACLLVSATILVVRWRRRYPWLATGWFWYLSTLLPVIGLVQVGFQSMADRYTYLPSIGLCIVFSWGGRALARRLQLTPAGLGMLGAVTVFSCLALSRNQARLWRDTATLFGHAVAVDQGNWAAHYYLGKTLVDQGKTAEGIEDYRAALGLRPEFPEAWFRLGEALAASGRLSEAVEAYRRALAIQPGFAEAELGLGLAYDRSGRWDEAAEAYSRAIRQKPGLTAAWFNLGLLQVSRGDRKAALEVLRNLRGEDPAAAARLVPFINHRFPEEAAR